MLNIKGFVKIENLKKMSDTVPHVRQAGVSWRAMAVMGAGALPWQALGVERCRRRQAEEAAGGPWGGR